MAFILDDLLFAPLKALIFIGEKVHNLAREEHLGADSVRQELRELYMKIEREEISEEEFEKQEEILVERMEALEKIKGNK